MLRLSRSFATRPSQRGQNLSERHNRLERSVRGKESLRTAVIRTTSENTRGPIAKPRPPTAEECCMSNCAVCVYDLYDEAMVSYNASIGVIGSEPKVDEMVTKKASRAAFDEMESRQRRKKNNAIR
ncbi:hypothetical protein C8J56DRAFT_521942 [Mycena floridula]|nr:hypothetical protein C8J56DRAFT_521942 [Mycena floridula]